MNERVLELQSIKHSFRQGTEKLDVLRNINITLEKGEIVALVGSSGSGKSTLLQIAGLLESPTEGEVIIAGKKAIQKNDAQRTHLRLNHLGFVYQFHNLLPEFSAMENIAMPQIIAGVSYVQATKKAEEFLDTLGLWARRDHRPAELSGGEQQRIAIARAMINQPLVILADEPTGNLDPKTAELVFNLFTSLTKSYGLAALVATHNMELARKMDRILVLNNGVL